MASPWTSLTISPLMSMLFFLLVFRQPPCVNAVNMYGYSGSSCSGTGTGFSNVPANTCYYFYQSSSVIVSQLSSCDRAYIYIGSSCSPPYTDSHLGPGWWCLSVSANSYYSMGWLDACSKTQSGEDSLATCSVDKACNSTVTPDAVIYTAPNSTGTWVLDTGSDKVETTLEQLNDVPDGQKVAWLQHAGALFTENGQ